MSETHSVDYRPDGATLDAFLLDDSFFRCIVGPFGSGKSAACAVELFRRACQQKPDKRGTRKSKWAAIRATHPQLTRTTIETWRQWFGDHLAAFRFNPTPQHHLILPLADKTVLDMHVAFIALDGPNAEADLRGAELTGAWLNEISDIPQSVLKFAIGRVGRFPPRRDGGPTWSGIVADSNAWDQDHWLHSLYTDPPEGWAFFRQPGAVVKVGERWELNPKAENQGHLPLEYYRRMLAGQSEDWIRVYLANEFGFSIDGKVVYPEWHDSVHVAPEPLAPIEGLPIHIGLDFGLTPAAIIGQKTARGQWLILDELIAEDMGLVRFSELLAERLDTKYGNFPDTAFSATGDPAGAARAQTDERTCLAIVRDYARLECRPAPTNEFTVRREAVAGALNRMVDGKPGFLLSPACKVLRKGFAGGYHYRRVRVSGDERFHDKPDKNSFSHPHDALQYLLSGAGEGRVVMRKPPRFGGGARPTMQTRRSPFSRGASRSRAMTSGAMGGQRKRSPLTFASNAGLRNHDSIGTGPALGPKRQTADFDSAAGWSGRRGVDSYRRIAMAKRGSTKPPTSSAPRPAPKPQPVRQPPPIVHQGKTGPKPANVWGGKK